MARRPSRRCFAFASSRRHVAVSGMPPIPHWGRDLHALASLTIFMMAGAGYAYLREGLLTAFAMLCNVLLAGFITFNFWEPLADILAPVFSGMFLAGYEDFICMMGLFAVTLGALRTATNVFANVLVQFPQTIQRTGGFLVGMLVGYLTWGFLVCVFQTMPWHQNFLGFDFEYKSGSEGTLRRFLPPDRVWLALMHRGGAYIPSPTRKTRGEARTRPPSRISIKTFDQDGAFRRLNYCAQHRRLRRQES